jgi:hypothetical protein
MEETEQRAEQENREEHAETEKPTSERESSLDQESIICPETEGKLDFLKEFEGRPITEQFLKSENLEQLKAGELVDSVQPLILTRCKSEPARTAEKLYADMNF